jgi:hypothetical protein
MKKSYTIPTIIAPRTPFSAAPLAFFSAATAAAAVGGLVAGAMGTKAAMKISPDEHRNSNLQAVVD